MLTLRCNNKRNIEKIKEQKRYKVGKVKKNGGK